MIEKFTMRNPVIDKIIDLGCDDFYADKDAVMGKSRRREIVVVRHAIIALCKEFTQLSLKNIGSHFGNRDHSSVIHALNCVDQLMETNKVFNQRMSDIKSRVLMALGGERVEGEDEEFYSELLHCENWHR